MVQPKPESAEQEWRPAEYLKFENLRLRPALELLNRVPDLQSLQQPGDAPTIIDLGAGSGNMGPAFLYVVPPALGVCRSCALTTTNAMLALQKAMAERSRHLC